MTEERKHAILFAATLLCARRIIDVIDTTDKTLAAKRHLLGSFEDEAVEQRRSDLPHDSKSPLFPIKFGLSYK